MRNFTALKSYGVLINNLKANINTKTADRKKMLLVQKTLINKTANTKTPIHKTADTKTLIQKTADAKYCLQGFRVPDRLLDAGRGVNSTNSGIAVFGVFIPCYAPVKGVPRFIKHSSPLYVPESFVSFTYFHKRAKYIRAAHKER